MKTLEFTESAGDDRLVHLAIPVEAARQPYHVVVHIQPATEATQPEYLSEEFIKDTAGKWEGGFPESGNRHPTEKLQDEWPPGFIERTYGGWKGELKRPPQGEYEERLPFDDA